MNASEAHHCQIMYKLYKYTCESQPAYNLPIQHDTRTKKNIIFSILRWNNLIMFDCPVDLNGIDQLLLHVLTVQ